jgi:hypothetical protein
MILSTTILLASGHLATESCIDVLDKFIKEVCISAPEIFEHKGGATQVYSCDLTAEIPNFVAVLSYDPDIIEAVVQDPIACSGSALYLNSDPEDLSLLMDIDRYADAFHY